MQSHLFQHFLEIYAMNQPKQLKVKVQYLQTGNNAIEPKLAYNIKIQLILKGAIVGHAILGNFSTNRMVVDLTKYQNNCSKL